MREFRPAEIRFYLHEECPRGRDAILSTQRVFARPGSDFIYTNRTSRKFFFALRAAYKGDDATKNDNFHTGKVRLQGYKNF